LADDRDPRPTLFDPAPFEAGPPAPPEPRSVLEVVQRYLGCTLERIAESEEADALARAFLVVHGLEDWEALSVLLDDCVEEWLDDPTRLLGVTLALARLAAGLAGRAAVAADVSPAALMLEHAAMSVDRRERALDALEAIADGVDSEPRDPGVVEMCAEMVRDATVAAAVDGIVLDRDELLDIELRALLEAEATEGEPSAGSH
jgi:hypothetical protein